MTPKHPAANTTPWDAYLGKQVKTLRAKRGLTQEQLATEVRRLWGLPWSRPTVTAIESGKRTVAALEFFALADLLEVSPQGLLASPEGSRMDKGMGDRMEPWLQTGPGSSVSLAAVLRAIEPDPRPPVLTGRDTPVTRSTAQQIAGLPELRRQLEAERVKPTPEALTQAAEGERGEAEKKAAVVLGFDPRRVAVLSLKLWGRSLTAERDARFDQATARPVGARSLRTLKGHITRSLITELRAAAGGVER